MEHGIERRFLVKTLPNLHGNVPVLYEKYFIQGGDVIEEAVQKRSDILEYEKRICLSRHECNIERSLLDPQEFDTLKKSASPPLVFKKYLYAFDPLVSINIFKENHDGFVRVDVKFDTLNEALNFEIPKWMGKDITQSPLGIDKHLAHLTSQECKKLIHQVIISSNT